MAWQVSMMSWIPWTGSHPGQSNVPEAYGKHYDDTECWHPEPHFINLHRARSGIA